MQAGHCAPYDTVRGHAGTIDAHDHLWTYTETDYGWIGDDMRVLKRDFLAPDLNREMKDAGIAGAVVVQVHQTLNETRWLLECARQTPSILGIVGWVPLTSPGVRSTLRDLRDESGLKGVRHILQDEPHDEFILRQDFNRGIAALLDAGLAYDILIHERHLPQARIFAKQHPEQRFVLDHLAKPKISCARMEPWRTHLMRLADCVNVCCKLSGLVTEANRASWTADDLHPYLDTALEAFGPERLMAGSDWPVCLAASSYQRWWSVLADWAMKLPQANQDAIFGGTARSFYHLD